MLDAEFEEKNISLFFNALDSYFLLILAF